MKKRLYKQAKYYDEYNKQRNQIKSKAASLVSRGYNVPADIIPPTWGEYVKSKGKNPDAAEIERLKRIKTKDIYEKTTYTERDLITGQTRERSYKYRREEERQNAAYKGSVTKKKKKGPIEYGATPLKPIPDEPPKEEDIIKDKILDELSKYLAPIYELQVFTSTAKDPRVNKRNTENVQSSGGILEDELLEAYNMNKESLFDRLDQNSTMLQALLSRPQNFYEEPASNQILMDILVIFRGNSVSFEEAKRIEDSYENTDYIDEEEWEDDLPF